jgi:hypothetical protein
MSRHLFGCVVACALALGMNVHAQNPPSNPQPRDPALPTAQATSPAPVTVEGCLVREQDVPGRKPNVAERAGVMEDYILTNTKIIKGSAPSGSSAEPKPGETPAGTSGASLMYDVKGIDDSRLKSLVGQRVQIDGTFADLVRSPTAKTGEDLADIRGTSIRRVAGECPPKK